ncbi:MAG: universal stress protein [Austwickia sp.]|nr:universal stress protein [Austwickia sp.]MBK8436257.1 universal stress protein [Austwickia sp.]MBK9101934.1 universal stress protein [Austwickia sp.]
MAEALATPITAPIVVLVDGSANSRAAVRFAGEWAKETGAPLMLRGAMSVWHRSAILRGHVEQALRQEMDRYAAELSADGGVVVGGTRAIVRFGRRTGALAVAGHQPLAVVLGMEGSGGWESTTRASTADEVSATVECPVIVVPTRAPSPPSIRRPVVVSLDDSRSAEAAFAFAVFWARAHAVPVVALRGPGVTALPTPVPADVEVEDRQVETGLAEAVHAAAADAGLVVVARAPSSDPGSAFHFLEPLHLQPVHCPVAVVRPH